MKLVLTAAKPQRVLLAAENGYVFLDSKWISCNDIICWEGRRQTYKPTPKSKSWKERKNETKNYKKESV